MAKQIRRKSISKKQQAILDKYADVVEQLDKIDEIGAREYNKRRSATVKAQKKVNSYVGDINQLKVNIRQLQAEGKSAIGELNKVDELSEKLVDAKLEREELKLSLNTVGDKVWVNGVAFDNVDLGALDETDNEIIDKLTNDLKNYSFKGDMLMTTFYHSYGFTHISKQAVAIFAKAEGFL